MTKQLFLWIALALQASPALAQPATTASAASARRDGQRDFDFEFGTWKTHLRRLAKPLSGDSTWAEYDGLSIVRPVWNGRGNTVELDVTGPAGRIQGLSVRLYNPQTRQWSLNYTSVRSAAMSSPVTGEFKNGRGEFYSLENVDGRIVLARFIITQQGRDAIHFEQSFSVDGGKTWEANWIADDTRVPDKAP